MQQPHQLVLREQSYARYRDQMIAFCKAFEKSVSGNPALPSVHVSVLEQPFLNPIAFLKALGGEFTIRFAIFEEGADGFGGLLEVLESAHGKKDERVAARWFFDESGNVKRTLDIRYASSLLQEKSFHEEVLKTVYAAYLQDVGDAISSGRPVNAAPPPRWP